MLGLGNGIPYSETVLADPMFSLSFDGINDELNLGDVLDIGTSDYSISIWLKLADAAGGTNFIYQKKGDNSNRHFMYTSSGKIVLYGVGGGNIVCNHAGLISVAPLDDTWMHICVSWDRDGNGAIYINGTTDTYGYPLHDLTSDTQDLDNTGTWMFMNSGGTWVEGYMTDIAMFDVALGADAVAAMHATGPFDLTSNKGDYVNSTDLTGYWRFKEGEGSTVADEIGSNDLTIVGATWSSDVP